MHIVMSVSAAIATHLVLALTLSSTVLVVTACSGALATGPKPFLLEWETSASEVEVGESFTLTIRIYEVQQPGEHGGISVSFPSLTDGGDSGDTFSSTVADVEAISYTTGLSNVAFHNPGKTIYHKDDNRMFPAEHMLVESDDPSWSPSDDRTLTLRITPKRGGEFPMRLRGWICAEEYTRCKRNPVSGDEIDQQGHGVTVVTVAVSPTSN